MNRTLLALLPAMMLGSCATHHLATADKAYDRMAYAKATCAYEKALGSVNDREAALRAADAYRRRNMPAKAADWYAYAERAGALNAEQALHYGQMLQQLGRRGEAIDHFRMVLTIDSSNTLAQELLLAAGLDNEPSPAVGQYMLTPLKTSGLTSAFSATPYRNGILFVGEREVGLSKRDPWNGRSFLDIYFAPITVNGELTTPATLPGEVNGRFHEGPMVLSPDGSEIYFTRSDYYKFRLNKDDGAVSHLMLYRARRDADGQWSNIEQFVHNGMRFSTGHPALSPDGRTLYFVSDRPGGHGGTDIWRCHRAEAGWSEPENLGQGINSPGNEMFPTMHGSQLYFASDGHQTMGGLDIFRTQHGEEGWSPLENLGLPFNSSRDDFSLVMLPDGESGYLSSNRDGHDGIYRFSKVTAVLSLESKFLHDGTEEPVGNVEVKLLDMTRGKDISGLTGPEGAFTFALQHGSDYRLSGSKEGMFTESMELSTMGMTADSTWHVEVHMRPVVMDQAIAVDNIYYDYDSWEIRPEAALELDKLARLFMDNPGLTFELSAHTDSRASHTYNLLLSEARAGSAVDYLIRKGVDPARLVPKGYGETRPVNHCQDNVTCSEEEHQANRRTEIKVIGMDLSVR